MNTIGVKKTAVALAVVAWVSTPAFAADIVGDTFAFALGETPWNSSVDVAKFDTALGTLTGVQFNWTAASSAVVTVTGTGTGSVFFDKLGADINFTAPGVVINSVVAPAQLLLTKGSGPVSVGQFGTGGVLVLNPMALGNYTGMAGDKFQLGFNATRVAELNSFGGGVTGVSDKTFGGGTVTVVYNYAPIPEPSTYALMLAGLVGVAAWAKRRKG